MNNAPSLHDIARAAAALDDLAQVWHGGDLRDVWSDSRRMSLVAPRHACARVLRRQGWTLRMIGALVNRDHVAVVNGLRWQTHPFEDLDDCEKEYTGFLACAAVTPHWLGVAESVLQRHAGQPERTLIS